MSSTTEVAGQAGLEASEARRLRNALGFFPTGVVIATAWDAAAGPLGMTMSSFTSVSLGPPLVMFSIDRRAASLAAWLRADGYAINVLASGQEHLSNQFARALTDKWQGVSFQRGLYGAPLLKDGLATFECSLHRTFDGGDHMIFLAHVERFTCAGDTAGPLVFHRGRYTRLAPASDAADLALPSAWPLSIHY